MNFILVVLCGMVVGVCVSCYRSKRSLNVRLSQAVAIAACVGAVWAAAISVTTVGTNFSDEGVGVLSQRFLLYMSLCSAGTFICIPVLIALGLDRGRYTIAGSAASGDATVRGVIESIGFRTTGSSGEVGFKLVGDKRIFCTPKALSHEVALAAKGDTVEIAVGDPIGRHILVKGFVITKIAGITDN